MSRFPRLLPLFEAFTTSGVKVPQTPTLVWSFHHLRCQGSPDSYPCLKLSPPQVLRFSRLLPLFEVFTTSGVKVPQTPTLVWSFHHLRCQGSPDSYPCLKLSPPQVSRFPRLLPLFEAFTTSGVKVPQTPTLVWSFHHLRCQGSPDSYPCLKLSPPQVSRFPRFLPLFVVFTTSGVKVPQTPTLVWSFHHLRCQGSPDSYPCLKLSPRQVSRFPILLPLFEAFTTSGVKVPQTPTLVWSFHHLRCQGSPDSYPCLKLSPPQVSRFLRLLPLFEAFTTSGVKVPQTPTLVWSFHHLRCQGSPDSYPCLKFSPPQVSRFPRLLPLFEVFTTSGVKVPQTPTLAWSFHHLRCQGSPDSYPCLKLSPPQVSRFPRLLPLFEAFTTSGVKVPQTPTLVWSFHHLRCQGSPDSYPCLKLSPPQVSRFPRLLPLFEAFTTWSGVKFPRLLPLFEAFTTSGVKVPQISTLVCSFHHLRCQGSPDSYPCLKLSPPQVSRFPRLLPLFEAFTTSGVKVPQTPTLVWSFHHLRCQGSPDSYPCLKLSPPQVSRFPRLLPLFEAFTTSGVKVPQTPTLVWSFHHLRCQGSPDSYPCLKLSPPQVLRFSRLLPLFEVFTTSGVKVPQTPTLVWSFHHLRCQGSPDSYPCLKLSPPQVSRFPRLLPLFEAFTTSGVKVPQTPTLVWSFHHLRCQGSPDSYPCLKLSPPQVSRFPRFLPLFVVFTTSGVKVPQTPTLVWSFHHLRCQGSPDSYPCLKLSPPQVSRFPRLLPLFEAFTTSGVKVPQTPTLVWSFHHLRCQGSPDSYPCLKLSPPQVSRFLRLLPLFEAFTTSGVKVPQTPTLVWSFHHLRCQGSPDSYPCLKFSPPQVSRFSRLLPLFEAFTTSGVKVPQIPTLVWSFHHLRCQGSPDSYPCLKLSPPQVSRFPRLLPLFEAFTTSGVKVPQTPTLVWSFHHLRCQGSPDSYPCLKLSPPQVSRFPRLLPLFEVFTTSVVKVPQTPTLVWSFHHLRCQGSPDSYPCLKLSPPQVSRFLRLLPLFELVSRRFR